METAEPPAFVALIADDFGRCREVNRAVLRAHRHGALTGASLMVTGDAFAEAVEIARATPSLSVGLHVVLADGRAASPPERIGWLADARGRFPGSPVRAGLRWLGPGAGRELDRELAAQFRRFASTGLPLRHVDGHMNLHLHPAVLGRVIRLARRYQVPRIRVPNDDLALALRHDRSDPLRRLFRWLALWPFVRRALRRVRAEGFVVADRCYGLLESGRMREGYVVAALERACGSVELYFHPTDGPRLDRLGPNPGDLQTLLSPAVRLAAERLSRRLRCEDGQPRAQEKSTTKMTPCSKAC